MIKQLAGCAIAGILLFSAACKDTDNLVNQQNNDKMRDTLKKLYPSLQVSQIRIEVKDFRDVSVLLGDKELYSESDEKLQEVTKQIADITYHLYEANNYLGDGKVTFIDNETTTPTDADIKREFDMHLEEYKK